ncbi:hypothetical protein ACFFRL_16710 [Agromyces hippuratus]|uniref:hypothetical protein n=1 Tax=Agromyces hippuratus TaxID=286438 RepID=UPI0035EBEED0
MCAPRYGAAGERIAVEQRRCATSAARRLLRRSAGHWATGAGRRASTRGGATPEPAVSRR